MVTLTLYGELDLATTSELDVALRGAIARSRRGVVVRISTLDFIGAAGLRSLETGEEIARRAGRTFVVVADNWQLRIASVVPGLKLTIGLVEGPEGWKMQGPSWLSDLGLLAA